MIAMGNLLGKTPIPKINLHKTIMNNSNGKHT